MCEEANPEEDDDCPHCKVGTLVVVEGREPWTSNHLQCTECCSTYIIN
jgi:hypothetical protein